MDNVKVTRDDIIESGYNYALDSGKDVARGLPGIGEGYKEHFFDICKELKIDPNIKITSYEDSEAVFFIYCQKNYPPENYPDFVDDKDFLEAYEEGLDDGLDEIWNLHINKDVKPSHK